MSYTTYPGHTTKEGDHRGSGAQAAPASRRRSRAIRWVVVAAGAAALAIPAAAAGAASQASQASAQTASTYPGPRSEVVSGGGYGSSRTPQFPTTTQIAAHEGGPSANHPLVHASGFPTTRQIAMHEGRLPENLPATTAVAPSSDGDGDTLAIVLVSAALLAGLGSVGFVVARSARVRPSA